MRRLLTTICIVALVSCGTESGSSTPTPSSISLDPGATWSGTQRVSEHQWFGFDAVAGDVEHFRVLQHGIDLAVEIWDARRTTLLLTVDSRNRADGVEELWWVPEFTGRYTVCLRPLAGSQPGGYEIRRRVPASQPSAEDRLRALAVRSLDQSHRALREREADLDSADRSLRKAIAIWQLSGEEYQRGLALFQLADLLRADERSQAANQIYRDALEIFRQLEDKELEIDVLFELGATSRVLGDFEGAWQDQTRGLLLARSIDDRGREAVAENNLGVLHKLRGELRPALERFHRAIALHDTGGQRIERVAVYFSLGQTYGLLGRDSESLEYLERARHMAHGLGIWRIEAQALSEIGWIDFRRGNLVEARSAYTQALDIYRSQEDRSRYGEATVLHRLSKVAQKEGDILVADDLLAQALDTFRHTKHIRDEAHALLSLAEAQFQAGDVEVSLATSLEALDHFRDLEDRDGELYALYLVALARGTHAEAGEAFRQALTLLDVMRRELDHGTLGLTFYDLRQPISTAYRDLLLTQHRENPQGGFGRMAFEVDEAVRARGLLEVLAFEPRRSAFRVDEPGEQDGEPRPLVDDPLKETATTQVPSVASFAVPEVDLVSLERIQGELLDADTTMLVYSLGEEESVLWGVSRDGRDIYTLPGKKALEQRVRAVSDEMSHGYRREAENSLQSNLSWLSKELLTPAEKYLHVKRLVIVSDGAIHGIPFSALPHPSLPGFLLEHHELVRLPSASVLAQLRKRPVERSSGTTSMAIFADPILDVSDQRLVGSSPQTATSTPEMSTIETSTTESLGRDLERLRRDVGPNRFERLDATHREVEEILKLMPAGRVLRAEGFEATSELATSGVLQDFQILHFATHAFVHDQHPELSGLVLSLLDEQGRSHDGLLRSHQIAGLRLTAELVVLSACKTAITDRVHAEGPPSLARSFFLAGARRLVVSLWNVDDRATAELMVHFYSALWVDRLPAAAALRQAQLKILQQEGMRSPYYWAAFEFQGEWE